MRPKSLILLTLALGCGLVASIGINQVMANRRVQNPSAGAELTPIFVAAKDIALGDPLVVEMVKLDEWPKDKVPPGAITKLEQLEGRRSRHKIYSGEPVLEAKLFAKGESGGFPSDRIPPGFRAISVKVDQSSGSGLILPGDRVDVLVHLRSNAGHGIGATSTKTFLQNVKVFAVNEVFEKTDEKEKSLMAKTISLLVTPAQAEMVALANELGEIRLVIRSADDDDMAETAGVTPMDLFENHSGKAPLAASSAASAAADVASNLLGLLNRQAKPALPSLGEPPVVVEPPKEETWTVTLLQGDKIDRVEIREGELPRIITGAESNSSQPASTIEPAVDETSLLEGLQPDPAPDEEEPAVE